MRGENVRCRRAAQCSEAALSSIFAIALPEAVNYKPELAFGGLFWNYVLALSMRAYTD
jgi:hypothetical protein